MRPFPLLQFLHVLKRFRGESRWLFCGAAVIRKSARLQHAIFGIEVVPVVVDRSAIPHGK